MRSGSIRVRPRNEGSGGRVWARNHGPFTPCDPQGRGGSLRVPVPHAMRFSPVPREQRLDDLGIRPTEKKGPRGSSPVPLGLFHPTLSCHSLICPDATLGPNPLEGCGVSNPEGLVRYQSSVVKPERLGEVDSRLCDSTPSPNGPSYGGDELVL